ncbi:hypothetical protein [Nocardia testacea]|uniref:hypothetical protein n=1 Tax=Nocardia testacea TaxID=248551 RepID=UPI00030B83E0|nr:hypothetical protein [Nocardia testacea]
MKFERRHYADHPIHYAQAEAGQLPAEVLTPRDRRLLVRQLVAEGMTDDQIAQHTLWTLYTTARVRRSIGLPPNQPQTGTAPHA